MTSETPRAADSREHAVKDWERETDEARRLGRTLVFGPLLASSHTVPGARELQAMRAVPPQRAARRLR